MIWDLPTEVEIDGRMYPIRSDYRVILDICVALTDPELTDRERGYVVLDLFYPQMEKIPYESLNEAVQKCFWFIRCGEPEEKNKRKTTLVSWEQDFQYIVAPINRVAGHEIRTDEYLHWWTFIGYYNEIGGDCTFAQIVRIRDKLAKGKLKDKDDRKWYQENKRLVDIRKTYTDAEHEMLKLWGGSNG